MNSWVPRLTQRMARHVLALFGVVGFLGAVVPVVAAPLPERAALEGRVSDMRRHLNSTTAGDAAAGSASPTLIAQASRWNNWPNWSNWANWRNG
jgi:hypothetical protein